MGESLDLFWQNPKSGWWFLIAAIAFILILKNASFQKRVLQGFVIAPNRSKTFAILKTVCILLSFIFAVFALMGPMGQGSYLQKVQVQSTPVLFLVDASSSMEALDTPSKHSRLGYAKEIVDQILEKNKGIQAALWAFTSKPTILSPETYDTLFLRLQLRSLQINEGEFLGTDFVPLFELVKKNFRESAPPLAILLTDGESTSTSGQNLIFDNFPYKVIAIGIGSQEGAMIAGLNVATKQNRLFLKEIAEKTNGYYIDSNFVFPYQIAFESGKWIQKGSNSRIESQMNLEYHYFFQIPLALSICFLLLSYLLPAVKNGLPIIALLFVHSHLNATGEQLAINNAEAGNFHESYFFYHTLEKELFKPWQKSIAEYNLGTILLMQGEYQGAAQNFQTNQAELPSVRERSLLNLARARYFQAKNEEDLNQKLFYLRQSLQTLPDNQSLDTMSIKAQIKFEISETLKQKSLLPKSTSPLEMLNDALAENPLQFATLKNLNMKDDEIGKAVVALKAGKELLAKLYLEQVKETFVEKSVPQSPEGYLNAAINAQSRAYLINLFVNQDKEGIKLAIDTQKKALQFANEFTLLVLKQQQEKFKDECQEAPWNVVFPLFNEGLVAAEKGLSLLDQDSALARKFQEKAVADWKLALEALLNPNVEEREQNLIQTDLSNMMQDEGKHDFEKREVSGVKPW